MIKIELTNTVPSAKPDQKIQTITLTAQKDEDVAQLDALNYTFRKLLMMAGRASTGGFTSSRICNISFRDIISEDEIDAV